MRNRPPISLLIALATLCTSLALSTKAANSLSSAKQQEDKQEFILKKEEHCISLTEQQTAALVAEDWQSLERLAKDYLVECKGYVSSQELSDRVANISIANINLGRFRQALASADGCIKIYYANPACHVSKAEALFAVRDKTGAIKALTISDRLARHALDIEKGNLEKASREGEKKKYGASVMYLESLLGYIERLGAHEK